MFERRVTFEEAVRLGFSNYFNFSGRAQRAEYWWFILFTLIGTIIMTFIDGFLFGTGDDGGPATALFSLATFIPSLSVGWRRLHDTDRSGFWVLLPYAALIWMVVAIIVVGLNDGSETAGLVAIMGTVGFLGLVVWVIVLLCKDSDETSNRFGPSPKYDETLLDIT